MAEQFGFIASLDITASGKKIADDLKKISAVYNTTSSGTTVYLQIEFNKNGKNILCLILQFIQKV